MILRSIGEDQRSTAQTAILFKVPKACGAQSQLSTTIHPRASWIRVSYAMPPNPDIQTLTPGGGLPRPCRAT
jgi:hypothetical protein